MRQGVGKARAIHVHGKFALPGRLADGGDLFDPIDRAPFGGLRQGDGTGFYMMYPEIFRVRHGFCQLFGANLAIGSGNPISCAPPLKNPGAPASSVTMWAASKKEIAP